MEVTTNRVHHSNLRLASPLEEVVYLQKQPSLAFSCFTLVIFFSISQKHRNFSMEQKIPTLTITSIYHLSLVIFEAPML